jgi:hypothetical protein
MKKIYLAAALTFGLAFTSCSDLEEKIMNEQDNTSLIKDDKNAAMLAAPAYASLRTYMDDNGMWMITECTTDECCYPTRGSDWNDANNRAVFTHTYDADNLKVRGAWDGLMQGITYCNVALNYLSELNQTEDVKNYTNEVTFIRTLHMFYLTNYFGHFPMRESDETDFKTKPQILDRNAATERIIKELTELIPNLKEKGEVPYGRITKAAAQQLLAHVYLDYGIFTGTKEGKWDDVINICNDVIHSGKYKLADDIWKLYLHDNKAYADQTEAVLPIVYDQQAGIGGRSWLNFTLHYSMTFNNFTSFWNGACTTEDFLNRWDTTDPRYQDNRLKSQIGFNLGIIEGQQYAIDGTPETTRNGDPLVFTRDFSVDNSNEAQGVRIVRYAPNPDYNYGAGSDNDVMFFRYSDFYLMRGEAKLRKGDAQGALKDINTIREIRGARKLTASELTLDSFFAERGFEFYWDGAWSRDDAVRFGQYCKARQNVKACDETRIMMPIPNTALEANDELKQNPGY